MSGDAAMHTERGSTQPAPAACVVADEACASGVRPASRARYASEEPAIRLSHVCFSYATADADPSGSAGPVVAPPAPPEHPAHRAHSALADVSLSVRDGEVVMLCGQSGCGKTTATRLMNGLIPGFFRGDLSGRQRVCGLESGADMPIERYVPLVGSVFQNPKTQYFNADTTSELAFPCENMGWESEAIRARLDEIAVRFGIGHLLGRSVFRLSGGEKQRLAVAAAMMLGPRLVVMDEPTGNLDATAMRDLRDMVAALKRDGVTVVIAEHRLAWCADVVDRYVHVADGAIAGEYTAAEFGALPADRLAAWGLRALDLNAARDAVRRKTQILGGDVAATTAQPAATAATAATAVEPMAPGIGGAAAAADAATPGEQRTVIAVRGLEIGYGRRSGWWRRITRRAAAVGGGTAADGTSSDGTAAGGLSTGNSAASGRAAFGSAAVGGPATGGAVAGAGPASRGHRGHRGEFTRSIADFDLVAGQIVGLMGRNGAGKSTLVRTLCGLQRPLRGQVLLHGRVAAPSALTRAGFLVMQDVNYQLFADSVREEVMLGADDDPEAAERCDRILASLDLTMFAERHPMSLSGGQKQRLAIASALMCGKDLIVLDEPTSGLDRRHMMQVGALLRRLADEGKAVLVVTHDDELAADWCDRILALDGVSSAATEA